MKNQYTDPAFERITVASADFILLSPVSPDDDFENSTEGEIGGDEIGGIF